MAHVATQDTQQAVRRLLEALSQRGLCRHLGLPDHWRGTISRCANGGPISVRAENIIRQRLGLPSLPEYGLAPICPHHRQVHAAPPCQHNGPVARVIVLRPGERIVRPRRRPQPPPWLQRATATLAALQRQASPARSISRPEALARLNRERRP